MSGSVCELVDMSTKKLIGTGGFGSVHSATMKTGDMKVVAVKSLNLGLLEKRDGTSIKTLM